MSRAPEIKLSVVSVVSQCGQTMYGVVHAPASVARNRVLILCQAGLQNKAGVGDYFRWLGDRLAAEGYLVVRFDPSGTGDSTGEVASDLPLNDFFMRIQSGAFKNDTLDWISWARKAFLGMEIFLVGQCGGCISALMACADQPQGIQGLILLATPVLLSTTLDSVREYDALIAGKGYVRKVLQPRSYMRLLGGKSEYRLIVGTVRVFARKAKTRVLGAVDFVRREPVPDHPMFNWHLWEAFLDVMRKKKPILFLNARLDNETPEFNDEFKHKVLDQRPAFAQLCQVEVLEKAEHSLMLPEARQNSLEAITRWLEALPFIR